MTPLDQALEYAAGGWPIFPCIAASGPARKRPHAARGFHDATTDLEVITAWWRHWSDALIGAPTGQISGWVVLDIDVKRPEANGFDTLEDLGIVLPSSPMVHTASGGLHVYFDPGGRKLRNSAGKLGPGLDVRGDGGYVILPAAGSGYVWDPIYNFDSIAPAAAPDWLWPPRPSRPISTERIKPIDGLSRYGEAAIDAACAAIRQAGPGEQERTLNAECFSIGTLAGAGAIPAELSLRALLHAANSMPDHDPRWPWRAEEIDFKVKRSFNDGTMHPREVRRACA